MSGTKKSMSQRDADQDIRQAYNDVNATVSVDGFLTGVVGRRVDLAISTTTAANDTETYTFSENGTNLYAIKIVYTDGTRATMLFATRIS